MSLVVRNGLVVTSSGIYRWDVKILNGIIAEIGYSLSASNVDEEIDASGHYVFPGVVDEHVHIREPGLEYKDDLEHGSKAAIKGGVTTVIDMPNTLPPIENGSRVAGKARLFESKSYVDFALTGVLHDGNVHEFEDMVEAGVVGFKVFMGPTTGNLPPPSDPSLYEIMYKSNKMKTRIIFHAEDHSLVTHFTEKLKRAGRSDPEVWIEARPPIAEAYSIAKIATMAKHTGGSVHIFHVSSIEAAETIELGKRSGVDITSETCPHYLLLDLEDYGKHGTLMKMNPPIRGGHHRKKLLELVANGFFEAIGSDHAPHSPEEKYKPVWDAAAGFPGVQTIFPLMLDLALKGAISITRVPQLLSENPARLFKLYPWKGAIMPGSSGDLIIVDPNGETEITNSWLEYKYKLSPYIDWRLRGRIKHAILRGNIVVRDGEITGKRIGRWIKPST